MKTTTETVAKVVKPKIKLRKQNATDITIKVIIALMIIMTLYYLFGVVSYKWEMFSPKLLLDIFVDLFRFDKVPATEMMLMLQRLINTVLLSVATTLIGAIVAFPLGLLATSSISNRHVVVVVRGIASIIRAIPTIVWVLVFIAGYGLSATTAIIGMTFHTVSFFVKSYSESFEEVDMGTIEALRASGANTTQIILGALLPSAFTKLISWLAMRSEVNFAVAVVIGPAVGVPGTIGTAINVYSTEGNYSAMGFGILCVFAIALIFELFITRLKNKKAI